MCGGVHLVVAGRGSKAPGSKYLPHMRIFLDLYRVMDVRETEQVPTYEFLTWLHRLEFLDEMTYQCVLALHFSATTTTGAMPGIVPGVLAGGAAVPDMVGIDADVAASSFAPHAIQDAAQQKRKAVIRARRLPVTSREMSFWAFLDVMSALAADREYFRLSQPAEAALFDIFGLLALEDSRGTSAERPDTGDADVLLQMEEDVRLTARAAPLVEFLLLCGLAVYKKDALILARKIAKEVLYAKHFFQSGAGGGATSSGSGEEGGAGTQLIAHLRNIERFEFTLLDIVKTAERGFLTVGQTALEAFQLIYGLGAPLPGEPGAMGDALPHITCDLCDALEIPWTTAKIDEVNNLDQHTKCGTLMIDLWFKFLLKFRLPQELLKLGKKQLQREGDLQRNRVLLKKLDPSKAVTDERMHLLRPVEDLRCSSYIDCSLFTGRGLYVIQRR